MKNRLKHILKCSVITAFCFMALVVVYRGIVTKYIMHMYTNENDEAVSAQLIGFGEIIEGTGQEYYGDERLEQEGLQIVGFVYGMQLQLIGEIAGSMIIGIITGIGIGYITSFENISKSSIKKLIVMYLIGLIIILTLANLYESILWGGLIDNNSEEEIVQTEEDEDIIIIDDNDELMGENTNDVWLDIENYFFETLPITGIYTGLYFVVVIMKIGRDTEKKVMLNKLLKPNEEIEKK